MTEAPLIAGPALKTAADSYIAAMKPRIENEQKGLPSVFDKWFTRVVARLGKFDPAHTWEDSLAAALKTLPVAEARALEWDFMRLRLFLDRWRQGRFVSYAKRHDSRIHYNARFGTEFGADVLLTCQGAPDMMHWRGMPLMKTVFDLALYPLLLEEVRPKTVFEIGSGSGASAIWLADHLRMMEIEARVHSLDLVPVRLIHSGVSFSSGDCARPGTLFTPELLRNAPHPWLVIEDAHHNVEEVLRYLHPFIQPGDYLVVEDSEIKRTALHAFISACPGYAVDTRYTDFFGRNATCSNDSIFKRME